MSPQLQEYADHFRQAQTEAHRVADGLTDEQFNWKPSPKEWSVGECITHLNIIAKAYVPAFRARLQEGGPDGEGPYRYGFVSRMFTNTVRPGGRSIPTAGPMNPSTGGARSDLDRQRALASLDEKTDAYVSICEALAGKDYSAMRMGSPFLALMRLPIGAYVDAMGLHAIRHVQQAERVTQRPGFPS